MTPAVAPRIAATVGSRNPADTRRYRPTPRTLPGDASTPLAPTTRDRPDRGSGGGGDALTPRGRGGSLDDARGGRPDPTHRGGRHDGSGTGGHGDHGDRGEHHGHRHDHDDDEHRRAHRRHHDDDRHDYDYYHDDHHYHHHYHHHHHRYWSWCDDHHFRWWFSFGYHYGYASHWRLHLSYRYCEPYPLWYTPSWGTWVVYDSRPTPYYLDGYCRPWYRTAEAYDAGYDDGYDDGYGSALAWSGGTSSAALATYVPLAPPVTEGWTALRDGTIEDAHAVFSEIVAVQPANTEARFGLVLASGLLGDDLDAEEELRRALRAEPEAIQRVPADEATQAQIAALLDWYLEAVRTGVEDTNQLVMVAALRTMLGDWADAYFAADAAIRRGGMDEGVHRLRALTEANAARGY